MPATPEARARTRAWRCAALRCLVAPQLFERAAAAKNMTPIVQLGFGVLVLIGLWLTFVGWIAKSPATS